MVGEAGDTSIHLASDVGVFEDDEGSVIAEHASNVAQLANESARRVINISKVLVGSSGNPTDIVCRAAHLSLVGFASPSFGGFAGSSEWPTSLGGGLADDCPNRGSSQLQMCRPSRPRRAGVRPLGPYLGKSSSHNQLHR